MKVVGAVASGTFGGGEKYLVNLKNGLECRGVDFSLVGSVPFESDGAVILPIGPKWSRSTVVSSVLHARSERRRYLRAIDRMGADIVHLQYKREQLLLSKAVSRNRPVVWTEHGEFPPGFFGSALGYGYRHAARSASVIICVSDDVRRSIVEHVGVPEAMVRVVENAVPASENGHSAEVRLAVRSKYGISDDEVVIVTTSRLEHAKGIDRILDAMSVLPEAFVMLVVGQGSARDSLEARAQEFGRRVQFTGFVGDVSKVLAAGDVFALPSRPAAREGVPMSLLEARAEGLGAVVSEDAAIDNWCRPRGIRIVEPSARSIAEGIMKEAELLEPARTLARDRAVMDYERWLIDHIDIFRHLGAGYSERTL